MLHVYTPTYLYVLYIIPFLGAFTKVRKVNISFLFLSLNLPVHLSVHLSVRMQQLYCNCTEFCQFLYWEILVKFVVKIKVCFKLDKISRRFTWMPA